MNNTTRVKRLKQIAVAAIAATVLSTNIAFSQTAVNQGQTTMTSQQALSQKQQAIAPIGAAVAIGDMAQLNAALNQGLDAGLTVSDTKEILVQLYAYTGFPRSLNALGELMKVVDARKQRGVQDAPGRDPGDAHPHRQGAACRRNGEPDEALGCSRSRPAVRVRPGHRRIPEDPPLWRHLRSRQPRLAEPRARHGGRPRCDDGCRVATAVPHRHQQERGPDGGATTRPTARNVADAAGRTRPAQEGGSVMLEFSDKYTNTSVPMTEPRDKPTPPSISLAKWGRR
jgi:alkylhydroperoxidase/carboxymuconolactone decarboxylase family protein YurZ